mgnify:CR=1 FL=1
MKNLTKVFSAGALSLFAHTSQAAFVLEDSISCIAGTPTNGITLTDVTGDLGGASNCWCTYDGNDPKADGFSIDGTIFNYVARDNADDGLEGADIGLDIDGMPGLTGTWAFDDGAITGDFLIVLKAASSPGYAVWLFEEKDAASFSGEWSVAWGEDLSHLSIYGTPAVPEVPVPAAAWLFGSGLIGLVGVARRKNPN